MNISASRFRLVKSYPFTVPGDYRHDAQLATVDRGKFTHGVNHAISDANFASATQRLVPGRTYEARIFETLAVVKRKDCLSLYRKEKGILSNAQGLLLVHQWNEYKLPAARRIVSYDQDDALPGNKGSKGLPGILVDADYGCGFSLLCFEDDLSAGICILVICELSPLARLCCDYYADRNSGAGHYSAGHCAIDFGKWPFDKAG
jgi:hypothetical protein